MKRIISLYIFLISTAIFAQVPQGISYQAIAMNSSGNPVVSSNVGIRLSILDNSATGTVLYTETQVKMTNPQGLFNLVIGQGTPTTGTFSTINWGTNSKFLKVELDVAGGTNYVLVGTTQLLSVPYALAAGSLVGSSANDSILENKKTNFAFASSNGNVYAYNQNNGTWVSQFANLSGTTSIVASNGNFAFAASNGNVYAFSQTTGNWIAQPGNLSGTTSIVSSNGNFAFAASNGNVYAFNKNTNSWVAQSGNLSGSTTVVATKNGSFGFASSNGNVYAFNKTTGTWIGQSGNLSGSSTIISGDTSLAYASSNGNVYVFNTITGSWVSQFGNLSGSTSVVSSSTN
ncbi:PQQ-binding-like beta-propeller repeat protein [Flavobacterium sp.]|jgi:hypothetical protein|uniref:outer membrane protein assembly factor BamB family protein n=1 Tax=Flavobacterium sp. TaxID=239 RepID=UPI0037C0DC25